MNNEFIKIREMIVNWNMTKRSLMELSIKSIFFSIDRESVLTIIEDSSSFLKYGKVGSQFYDILIMGSTAGADKIISISNLILELCKSNSPYEFVSFIQNLFLEKNNNSPEFNGVVISLASLIFSGYGCGYLVGIDPKEKVVYTNPEMLGSSEFFLVLLIHYTEKFGSIQVVRKSDSAILEFSYSKKQYARAQKYFSKPEVGALLSSIRQLPSRDVAEMINRYSNSIDVIYFANFFNCLEDGSFPYFANIYKVAGWEREDTHNTNSIAIKLYQAATDKYFEKDDVLRLRNLYIPDKGIIIKFANEVDGISSLMLREYHYEEMHFLYVSYSTGELGDRFIPIDMTDLNGSFIHILYETDTTVLWMVINFLGISEHFKKSSAELGRMFGQYNNLPITEKELDMYSESLTNLIDGIGEYVRDENIYFEAPVHWNYTSQPKKVNSPWGDTYLIKDKKIGRYTRRLPAGQKASEEAKSLAKEVFMDLGDDKTIVDEFVRKVRTKVNT